MNAVLRLLKRLPWPLRLPLVWAWLLACLVFGIVVLWPLGILAHIHTSLTNKPWKRLTGV